MRSALLALAWWSSASVPQALPLGGIPVASGGSAPVWQQNVGRWGGSSPATSGSWTPYAANDVAIVFSSNSGSTITISGTGTYSAVSPPGTFEDNNFTYWNLSANTALSAGAQTTTVTASGGNLNGFLLEYSGAGTSLTGAKTLTNTPGTGSGAIQGTAVTVPSNEILVAFFEDTSSLSGGTITSPSGTSRASGSWNGFAFAVTEYAGTGASITPSATSSTGGTDNFVVIQVLIP
jgi:hypothetical protein